MFIAKCRDKRGLSEDHLTRLDVSRCNNEASNTRLMHHFHSVRRGRHFGVGARQLEHVWDAQPLPRLPAQIVRLRALSHTFLLGCFRKCDEGFLKV